MKDFACTAANIAAFMQFACAGADHLDPDVNVLCNVGCTYEE